MNIIIIEDEIRTAKSLEKNILEIKPQVQVLGKYQSVQESVEWLSSHHQPDLIFMDIQLADGLCFEIFKAVKITCPVVFCTAFDEYTLEAFKSNGVDYILKPFTKEDISNALQKVQEMKNFFQRNTMSNLDELLLKINPPSAKTSFLVFKHQKYTTVQTEQIAFFYIKNNSVFIMCFDKEEFQLNQSMDSVANQVSEKQFFRLNRQYLVNFKAIKEVEHYFLRKLYVKLVIETSDKLLVNKEKSHNFLSWMENR